MTDNLATLIRRGTVELEDGSGTAYPGLTLRATADIADKAGLSRKEVEIAALKSGVTPARYLRNIPTLGADGQARLLSSAVAVVGAGGLGGLVIELSARVGIGTITVIDGDSFSEDNLNRQILAREEDLGRKKAARAAERGEAVNSAVEVISRPVFLNRENAAELLEGADVIVDALDRIDIRLILEDAAGELDRPLVHGAIGGFLGEIATVLPGRSRFSNLYPATEDREGGLEKVLGTPTPVPAVVAAFEVIETIKLLLGKGRPFSEEILYLELLDGYFSRIRLKS